MNPQIGDSTGERSAAATESGIYLHFPWCLKKCPYCDFVSFATERAAIDHRGYADAVLAEMDQRRATLEGRRVGTVFLGGGTPSLWEAEEIGRVLARIRERGDVSDDVEITVECNPTSRDDGRARALGTAGANRLSVGAEGRERSGRDVLGRLHEETGGPGAWTASLMACAAPGPAFFSGPCRSPRPCLMPCLAC